VPTWNPAAPYLAPALVLIASTMITGALSDGSFDRLYPLRVALTLTAFWAFRREYAAMACWGWSWGAVALGALTFVVWMALEPTHRSGAVSAGTLSAALAGLPRVEAAGWLFCRVFGSVVTVSLAEELAFRGFLSRRLIAAEFQDVTPGRLTWPSFFLSSLAFGLLHQRWLAGTLAGMLFALAYNRRGRLGDAVLAHATANALIAAWVLVTGDWSVWA
jgi:CAAX prenyl protease-like protein